MSINLKELNELLQTISQTDLTEISLKTDEFELTVKKGGEVKTIAAPVLVQSSPAPQLAPAPTPETQTPPPPSDEPSPPPPLEKKWKEITSPMVGTFYRAPGPDEAPFVQVGDRLSIGQTVCIIEAMKLMNEIEAEISGEVMEIVVDNGQPVEYGQTLMWINPA